MADLVWTATTLLHQSGQKQTRVATETVAEGDWVYEVTVGSTIGVATNTTAAKAVVFGQALNGGVTGKDITVALTGSVINATATPAIALAAWYVLSAAGATSPIADQTTADQVSMVARGTVAGTYQIEIVNTGLVAP